MGGGRPVCPTARGRTAQRLAGRGTGEVQRRSMSAPARSWRWSARLPGGDRQHHREGTAASNGLKKGQVINIEQTVASIRTAVEAAERLSGLRLEAAFVGVGGSHVESLNSKGAVAVGAPSGGQPRGYRAGHGGRACRDHPVEPGRCHVLPRDFTVDGQEGVKGSAGHERGPPRGGDAHRALVAHGPPEPDQSACARRASAWMSGGRIARLGGGGRRQRRARPGRRGRGYRARVPPTSCCTAAPPFHTSVLPIGGINVTNDVAIWVQPTSRRRSS